MSDTDLTQTIADAAINPASASGDGFSVTQHNLKDLIAADKHLAGKTAVAGRGLGIKFNKIKAPGTV